MHVVDFNLKFGLSNVKTLDVMLPHPFWRSKALRGCCGVGDQPRRGPAAYY